MSAETCVGLHVKCVIVIIRFYPDLEHVHKFYRNSSVSDFMNIRYAVLEFLRATDRHVVKLKLSEGARDVFRELLTTV